jgi:hypothetical protein
VDEDLLLAGVRVDKPIPLEAAEPLDGARFFTHIYQYLRDGR